MANIFTFPDASAPVVQHCHQSSCCARCESHHTLETVQQMTSNYLLP